MRQVILDTETTGLSIEEGHRIIEVGCIELVDRRYTGKYFHKYFNPEREIDAGALQVHGITNEFLSDKPFFIDLAEELLAFIQDAELIIHNAPFDVGFLDFEFRRINANYKAIAEYCLITDTLTMARQKHPGQHNSLDALCRRYHIDNSQRDYHGALLDAKLLAEVYLAMTGGQVSLFNDESHKKPLDDKVVIHSIKKQLPLPILYANETELAAHAQRLQALKKAAGKLLWPIAEDFSYMEEKN